MYAPRIRPLRLVVVLTKIPLRLIERMTFPSWKERVPAKVPLFFIQVNLDDFVKFLTDNVPLGSMLIGRLRGADKPGPSSESKRFLFMKGYIVGE